MHFNEVIKMATGNILPRSRITISLVYVENIQISRGKFWRYVALRELKPKYPKNKEESELIEDMYKNIYTYPALNENSWKIEVELESQSKIMFVESPSYKIVTEYDVDMKRALVKLDPKEIIDLDRDFILYFSSEKIEEP
jgi:hypothetical protein